MSELVGLTYIQYNKSKTLRTIYDFYSQDSCLQKHSDDQIFIHIDCNNCNDRHFQVLMFHMAHKHNLDGSSPQLDDQVTFGNQVTI